MTDWLRAGPLGFARRAMSYRSLDIAKIIQRNLSGIVTPTHAKGKRISIPELEIVIDPFRQEHILIALPQLVSLKRRQNASLRVFEETGLEIMVCGLTIITQALQDILIVYEVFDVGVYSIQMPARTIVWDIGANIGLASMYFAKCLGYKVVAYEPFPQTAATAIDNIARNRLNDEVELVVAGIAGSSRQENLNYYHEWRGSNGLFGSTRQGPKGQSTRVEVQVLDAGSEFERIRRMAARGYIVAKIDCEGAEYEIIRRLRDAEYLTRIDALALEMHEIPNEDPEELIAILREAGMMVSRRERSAEGLQLVYATQVQRGRWA